MEFDYIIESLKRLYMNDTIDKKTVQYLLTEKKIVKKEYDYIIAEEENNDDKK